MKELWYLFTAYLLIWVGLWAYAVGIGLRQRRIRQQMEGLMARLKDDHRCATPASAVR